MREIKFRAKAKSGNWVFGNLVYDSAGDTRIANISPGGYGLTFHECINGTEGQFTGLNDKNGNEIYEGDILSDEFLDPYEGLQISRETVFFDVKLGTWMLDQSAKQDGSYTSSLVANLEDYEYTVIGNIHETPN